MTWLLVLKKTTKTVNPSRNQILKVFPLFLAILQSTMQSVIPIYFQTVCCMEETDDNVMLTKHKHCCYHQYNIAYLHARTHDAKLRFPHLDLPEDLPLPLIQLCQQLLLLFVTEASAGPVPSGRGGLTDR